MAKIRRLTCFDYPKLKKLISYLCTDDNDKLAKNLTQDSISFVNAVMPLTLKFKSESFILVDKEEILGLITVVCTPGNPYKINVTRLIFKENLYDAGKHLIEFVLQKYGGKGANAFSVVVDECHTELLDLFVNGCGFRQCSSETLWKIERPEPFENKLKWRYAQNSDAKRISELYNDELIPIYKPSLLRRPNEFKPPFFQGFTSYYKTRYVIEETNKLIGYFSITTADNLNYILDMTINSGYDLSYEDIINAMLCEIASKKRAFYALVKQKNYVKNSQKFGEYLVSKGYSPVQTQHILVKDFYRPIREESKDWKVFILGESQITG